MLISAVASFKGFLLLFFLGRGKNLLFTISVQSSVEAAHANSSEGEDVLVLSVKIWKRSTTSQKLGREDFA